MKIYFLLLFLCLSAPCILAQENKDLPERPNPPRLVTDLTHNTLNAQQIHKLEIKLRKLKNKSSSQVAVVILPTLNGYEIGDYAVLLIKKWGIWQKDNNVVLLLIAMQDHKTNITTGYGLEGALTDLESKQILDNIIRPAFRNNKYYKGINKATSAIAQAIIGEYNVK